MLLDGKTLIYNAWWMTVFPGIFIVSTILAINLLGDGLRDLLDPTYRGNSGSRRRRARKAAKLAAKQAPRTAAVPAVSAGARGENTDPLEEEPR